jgi:hypothetical protein
LCRPRVDRQSLIDRAGDGIEGARIEAGELGIGKRDLSGPLQRADQCDRAQTGPFHFGD